TPTGCPGAGIQSQIDSGLTNLDYQPPKEAQMQAIDHIKAYDSRPQFQHEVDKGLASFNKNVPRRPLQPGESRTIAVGGIDAFLNVVAIGHGGAGFLSLAGANTSVVGYDSSDRIEYNACLVKTQGGTITVTAHVAPCDFAIEVQGRR